MPSILKLAIDFLFCKNYISIKVYCEKYSSRFCPEGISNHKANFDIYSEFLPRTVFHCAVD